MLVKTIRQLDYSGSSRNFYNSRPRNCPKVTGYNMILNDFLEKSFKIQRNNLLATIDNWGPYFRVSFDLKIHSKVNSVWSSILAFKGNGGSDDLKKYGDRAPAIFYNNKDGYLHFINAVSGNRNYGFNYNIDVGNWYHIEIIQKLNNDGQVWQEFNQF